LIDIEKYNRENELRELKSSTPTMVLDRYKDKTFLFDVDKFSILCSKHTKNTLQSA
jgi:hypothetical protein